MATHSKMLTKRRKKASAQKRVARVAKLAKKELNRAVKTPVA